MAPGADEGVSEQPGYGWYGDASASAEQGDVIPDFRIVIPVAEGGEYAFRSRLARVVILTQTCDIPKPGQRNLLVADVHNYDMLVREGNDHLRTKDYKQALARGTTISDFLLPPSLDSGLPWSVISFRDVFVVPKELLLSAIQNPNVKRIMSPYKEYLSQAFARFVMRVGLPSTLSSFEKYKPN